MRELSRLGLVQPLGLVGQEVRRLLADDELGWHSVTLLGSRDEGGTLTEVAGEAMVVHAIEPAVLAEADAFLIAGPITPEARELLLGSGKVVLDARDVETGGALVAPRKRARAKGQWLRLASPATIALLPLVEVLRDAGEVTRLAAVVFEPVAELDGPGIDELHAQTVETLNLVSATTSVLGVRRAFDLIPDWGRRPEREARVVRDLSELAQLDLRPEVTLFGASVYLGLGALVSLEFADDIGVAEVAAAVTGDSRFALCRERPATPGDLPDLPSDPIFAAVAPGDGGGIVRIFLACDYVRRCRARAALEVLRDYLPS